MLREGAQGTPHFRNRLKGLRGMALRTVDNILIGRSEVPIRIPSIPHLLIPSPLTPTRKIVGGGGGVVCGLNRVYLEAGTWVFCYLIKNKERQLPNKPYVGFWVGKAREFK